MRLIPFIILLCSCSASYHAKRAIKKNPQAFKADTTIVIDTIVLEVPKIDTTFIYQFDTVEYIQEDVKIKYHFDTLTNQVYIEADCPDQEIITKTETITLPPILIKPTFWERIQSGFLITLIIVITLFFARMLIKLV